MLALFNSNLQTQSYSLQTIRDYKLYKTIMDQFDNNIRGKRYPQEQINFYLSEI